MIQTSFNIVWSRGLPSQGSRGLQNGMGERKLFWGKEWDARKRKTKWIRGKELGRELGVSLDFGISWMEWVFCASGQVGHLQGHENYLTFSLLLWHHWQKQLHLGPRNLFQKYKNRKWSRFGPWDTVCWGTLLSFSTQVLRDSSGDLGNPLIGSNFFKLGRD